MKILMIITHGLPSTLKGAKASWSISATRKARIHRKQVNIHIYMVYNVKHYKLKDNKTFISKTKLL